MNASEIKELKEFHGEDFIRYYSRKETKKILSNETTSYLVRKYNPVLKHGCFSVYVVIEGDLTILGWGDLEGQVFSSVASTSDSAFYEDPLKFYREEATYGSVLLKTKIKDAVEKQCLFVLTSMTDG